MFISIYTENCTESHKNIKNIYLFEGVRFANDPSYLPLCAVFTGCSCGFALGTARPSRRSNVTLLEVYSVSPHAV